MASNAANVNFLLIWKIDWSEFLELSQRRLKKSFSTAYNSVVFFWSVEMSTDDQGVDPDKFGLFLGYRDGPLATVEKMNFKVAFMKPDSPNVKSVSNSFNNDMKNMKRGSSRWCVNLVASNVYVFRMIYGFSVDEPMLCQITLQIPTTAFSFAFQNPLVTTTPPQWMIDLFKDLENPEKTNFSNAKLVSRDGSVFYCDKVVLARQSKEFEKMFNFPPAKGQPKNTYPFPEMGNDSLKAALEYLYTGRVDLSDTSTATIMEVADAAEQFNLGKLKEMCRAALWNQLGTKIFPVKEYVEIICFVDLHDDFKYVKQRAIEILAEKSGEIAYSVEKIFPLFKERESGDALMKEFASYCAGRVEGYFSM